MKNPLLTLEPLSPSRRSLSRLFANRIFAVIGFVGTLVLGFQPVQAAVVESWIHRFNGSISEDDKAEAVALDKLGNIVVTGYSRGQALDYYTAKYAAHDGSLLWEKRYNGALNYDDKATAVAVDASGNVVVTGQSYGSSFTGTEYYTAKYAAHDGSLLWEKHYIGPGKWNVATAVGVDGSDNVVVTGYSHNGSNYDYYTVKYEANSGRFLWGKRYNGWPGDNDYALALAIDGSGNVVVTGMSHGGIGADDDDYYTAKYAALDGALLWEKRENGPTSRYDRANAVAIDNTGNVVVTGESQGDYYTVKYAAADGATLWSKRYNEPANGLDTAQAVAIDNYGNVVVTGSSDDGLFRRGKDYYTAKYATANGALLWEKRYNSLANRDDVANAVALDGSGNVVVTGYSISGTSSDYYTAKYAGVDGALLWEKRYNGPRDGEDRVGGSHSLAVGADGMVVVTGSSIGEPGAFGSFSHDYATIVYAEHLPPLSISLAPTGIGIRFPGVADHRYHLLQASELAGPWSTNATLGAVTNGIMEYVDTSPRSGASYYRTAAAP